MSLSLSTLSLFPPLSPSITLTNSSLLPLQMLHPLLQSAISKCFAPDLGGPSALSFVAVHSLVSGLVSGLLALCRPTGSATVTSLR